MRKLITILTLSAFITVGCNLPTEPQRPNEIDSIEMMLKSVNDEDVPVALTFGAGDDDKKGKGKKGKGRKPSFRKVIHRLSKYLSNHPNEEAQSALDAVKVNMATIKEKFKNKDKEGLRELVKETRQLLRKAIKAVREARKSD
jgi:hypothetical protein